MSKIPRSYYLNPDVVFLAEDLLGKVLVTDINGVRTSGIITETEAYAGVIDKASHAFGGRRTNRNEMMYGEGGNAYVYLCYGIHHLFNIVTNDKDIPHAVLIRAIFPHQGKEEILLRRGQEKFRKGLTVGPGKVSMALDIYTRDSGTDLTGNRIWLEDEGIRFTKKQIRKGPRIGVDYAGKDALLPYRFWVDHSIFG